MVGGGDGLETRSLRENEAQGKKGATFERTDVYDESEEKFPYNSSIRRETERERECVCVCVRV